jgi:two-component system, chemotaxis family, chemotaxis protein CheY
MMRNPAGPADVLLIDDDPDVRLVLTRLLECQGYSVATAANGWQALEYLRHSGPSRLVLLDLMMPEMDGWEFLHERRHSRDLWEVPVVVFSAETDFKGPDPRGLGAAAVLHKPFQLSEVLDAARRYCLRAA